MMSKKIKVIIDTDIGDDIDDAFALLLATNLDIEIIGITTVFLNTSQRARMTKKLLTLCGDKYKGIPVFAGYGTPLAEEDKKRGDLCQYTPDIENEIYAPDSEKPEDAIDFIIDSCKKYKDELTVIALGPFTNVAMAVKKDNDALNLAGRIIIMGGAFYKQYADWNVMCDVEAADIMFRSVKNIKCIGADVTHKLKISRADDEAIVSYSKDNPLAIYISELYRLWKKEKARKGENDIGILHDPLTVYYAFDEGICECEEASLITLTDGPGRGMILNIDAYGKSSMNPFYRKNSDAHRHTVAKEVDREKILSEFRKCFN